MIRLDLKRKPFWIDLLPGVRVRVEPMSSALWMMARADDGVLVAAKAADAAPLTPDEGSVSEDGPALSDGGVMLSVAMTRAIAARAITKWEGVGDEAGNPLPPSPGAVAALLDIFAAYEAFCAAYIAPWLALAAEKKE